MVQALPSLQSVGQTLAGSQVSPGSTCPLPQLAEHSESFACVQPEPQQLSLLRHSAICLYSQRRLQVWAEPTSSSVVQAVPSSHVDGHVLGGSQVSPGSIFWLPQTASHETPPSKPHFAMAPPCTRSISFRSKSVTALQPVKASATNVMSKPGAAFIGNASVQAKLREDCAMLPSEGASAGSRRYEHDSAESPARPR